MDHGSDMGAYSESSNVQNGSNYITIIPVEYPRRGYPVQAEYQYRTREEYYNIQTQKLQAEVNAHLYSVSQRLPQLSSYSPIGRHNDWEKHSDMQKTLQNETKESNSSDSLEKSIMGSNMSSCSNQTASSSTAAGSFSTTEQITSGNSTFSAISPPLPGTGSSGSTTSSSSVNSPTIICVYMMSRTAVMVELAADEVPAAVTASRLLAAVLSAEELGLTQASRALATNVFSLWMCSPLLEVQLSGQQCPWQVCTRWRTLVTCYGHGSPNRLARDHPILRVQRNLFYPTHHEDSIKDSRIQELLFEERADTM